MSHITESEQQGRESRFKEQLEKLNLLSDIPASPQHTNLLGSATEFFKKHVTGNWHAPEKDDLIVWIFDNAAWRPDPFYTSTQQPWQAEFIAAFFLKGTGHDASDLIGDIGKAIGIAKGDEAEKRIEERVRPLLNLVVREQKLAILVDHSDEQHVGPSGADGISRNVLVLPAEKDATYNEGKTIESIPQDVGHSLHSTTSFVEGTGWMVVSDVDDTIKKTLTSDPVGILKTTFADIPEPIAGMPEFYKYMSEKLAADGKQLPFWYLSASPYNLYPFLREFRDKHYPHGPLLLKNASWMNLFGFIASMAMSTREYKYDHLKGLHIRHPKRSVICIGDSTQSDPEAYADMYRAQPRWVKKIFIRKVKNVTEITDFEPGKGEEERNAPERFKKAFEGVPDDVWKVFEDPKELYSEVDGLIGKSTTS